MTRDERAVISILNAYKEGYESAMEDYKQKDLERQTGKWIAEATIEKNGRWDYFCYQNFKCSKCGYIVADSDVEEYKYCPNCGCFMKGERK